MLDHLALRWEHASFFPGCEIGHALLRPAAPIEGPSRAAGAVPDAAIYRDMPPCAARQLYLTVFSGVCDRLRT